MEKTERQEISSMKKKCKMFFDLGRSVHVVLKTSKWYNGQIIKIKSEFFVVKDKKGEMPVQYQDLYKIEPYELE